ncbi:hypothetical protein SDC9_202084 [bioreactor metagenome]|uniref:Uncharacterized protein n=1 Tax=bioreactor metagenome TaxID=1076179 RepID=A0A645J1N9_9ZZZZ
MVADHDIRTLLLARVVFYLDLNAEFFKIEQLPKITQRAIDQLRGFVEFA